MASKSEPHWTAQLLIVLGIIAAWPLCGFLLYLCGLTPQFAAGIGFWPAAWIIGTGMHRMKARFDG